jgi:hypothetical protein
MLPHFLPPLGHTAAPWRVSDITRLPSVISGPERDLTTLLRERRRSF